MPFSNSILAGNTLVREAIQSEPYTPGSTGWQIRRDGNADFNNVTVRGEVVVGTDPQALIGIRNFRPVGGAFSPGFFSKPNAWQHYGGMVDEGGFLALGPSSSASSVDIPVQYFLSPESGLPSIIFSNMLATPNNSWAFNIGGVYAVTVQGNATFSSNVVKRVTSAYQADMSGGSVRASETNDANVMLVPAGGSGTLTLISTSVLMHASRRYRILGLTRAHPTNAADFGAIIAAQVLVDGSIEGFDRQYLPNTTGTARTMPLRPEAPDFIPATSGTKTIILEAAERDTLTGNVGFRGAGGSQFLHKLVVWDMGAV